MSDLWGPISASTWRDTPHIAGRAATEADVSAGLAVFYIAGESTAAPIALPCCAYQLLKDGSQIPVVVIQAEIAPQGVILGVRPISGGNGVCTAEDLRILPGDFESSVGT